MKIPRWHFRRARAKLIYRSARSLAGLFHDPSIAISRGECTGERANRGVTLRIPGAGRRRFATPSYNQNFNLKLFLLIIVHAVRRMTLHLPGDHRRRERRANKPTCVRERVDFFQFRASVYSSACHDFSAIQPRIGSIQKMLVTFADPLLGGIFSSTLDDTPRPSTCWTIHRSIPLFPLFRFPTREKERVVRFSCCTHAPRRWLT